MGTAHRQHGATENLAAAATGVTTIIETSSIFQTIARLLGC